MINKNNEIYLTGQYTKNSHKRRKLSNASNEGITNFLLDRKRKFSDDLDVINMNRKPRRDIENEDDLIEKNLKKLKYN